VRRLMQHIDAAAGGLVDWSEFDAEAERWGIEIRGLSREDLSALIESSTREIPAAKHRRLHRKLATSCDGAGAGTEAPSLYTVGLTSRCSPASAGAA
jgi:hypothetical protein